MPLTTDDILMGYTIDHITSIAVCKVCGYSDTVYFDPWEHTLTDCMRQIKQELSRAKTNLPDSPA